MKTGHLKTLDDAMVKSVTDFHALLASIFNNLEKYCSTLQYPNFCCDMEISDLHILGHYPKFALYSTFLSRKYVLSLTFP